MPDVGTTPSDLAYLDKLGAIRAQSNVPVQIATAQNIISLAHVYPGMAPGTLASLGRAGIGPGAQAEAIWKKQLAQDLSRGKPGEVRHPKNTTGHDPTKRADLKAGIRAGELTAKQANILNQVTHGPGPLDQVAGLADQAIGHLPNALQPGVQFLGGQTAPDPLHTNALPVIGEGLRTASRTAATAGMAPLEALTGAARQNFGVQGVDPLGVSPSGATNVNAVGSSIPLGTFAAQTAAQTTLGQAVNQQGVAGLFGAGQGEGYMPNPSSAAARAQAEAARQYSPYLVGGHAWTPGRAVADMAHLEPGTDAFNLLSGLVDARVAMRYDPTNAILSFSSDARKVSHVIEEDRLVEAGAISAFRKMHSPKLASAYMDEQATRDVFNAMGNTPSEWRIWQATGTTPETRIPPYLTDGNPILSKLAATTNGNEAADLIRPYIATEFSHTGISYDAARHDSKLWSDTPGQALTLKEDSPTAINESAANADLALFNAKASDSVREMVFNKYANAMGNSAEKYGAAKATFTAFGEKLKLAGIDSETIDKTVRMMGDEWEHHMAYMYDLQGEPLLNKSFVQVGDSEIQLPHPVLENQLLNSDIILPDQREIRRMVSTLQPLVNNPLAEGATALVDGIMDIWRKTVVGRPATGLRVVGEEQARIATQGYASAFRHPLTAIAYMLGNPDERWINRMEEWGTRHTPSGRAAAELSKAREQGISLDTLAHEGPPDLAALEAKAAGAHKVTGAIRRGKESVAARPWFLGGLSPEDDLFMKGMYTRFQAAGNEGKKIRLRGFDWARQGDPNFARALGEELQRSHDSKIGRAIVGGMTRDELVQSLTDGDLKDTRLFLATDPRLAALGDNPLAIERHADIAIEGLRTIHSDNPTLLEAIRTGQVNGKDILGVDGHVTPGVQRDLQNLIDTGVVLPKQLKMDRLINLDETKHSRAVQLLDNGLSWLLSGVLSRPSNYFSRNPTLQQSYLKRWEELFPHMNTADRAALLDDLHLSNVGKLPAFIAPESRKTAASFWEMDRRLNELEASGHGLTADLTYDAATLLAKHHAIGETKNLLYDLSKRSRFMDLNRAIIPFGEAFREVVSRWAKLTWENPRVIRRVDQGIMGAQRSGFFQKDQFGQEVFVYPGSDLVNEAMGSLPVVGKYFGTPIPLQGGARGLNIVADGIPGVGPGVQISYAYLAPNKPSWDSVRKVILPYGSTSDNIFGAVGDALLPTWAKRLRTLVSSPDSDREYAAAVIDTAKYLSSTGNYQTHSADGDTARSEMSRLLDDAKDKAKGIYVLRVLGSATLPASPTPKWLAEDKSGNLTTQWRIAQWFQKKSKEEGYNAALNDYFAKFGVDNAMILQPKSKSNNVAGLAQVATVAGSKWIRDHPELRDQYPSTYGLFAPHSGGFDNEEYRRQFTRGEKTVISPRDAIVATNARIASFVYHRTASQYNLEVASASGAERSALRRQHDADLRDLRSELRDEFPGYAPGAGSPTDPVNQINELYRASEDPYLKHTPAGRALNQYLGFRNQAIQDQWDAGLTGETVSTAQSMAADREWLTTKGEEIVAAHPAFQPLWDVLSREVD